MRDDRHLFIATVCLGAAVAPAAEPDPHAHHNHAQHAASASTGEAKGYDFFTNYGNYMPRTHCLLTVEGKPDWPWIIALIALTGGVVVNYLRIFIFWMQSYYQEQP